MEVIFITGKDVFRLFGVSFTGLLVAMLIYPFLHELGHTIASLIVGAEVVDFNLFPIPFIVCNSNGINEKFHCVIGIAGMIFPLLISLVLRKKNFWWWLVSLALQLISLLAFAISYLANLFFDSGHIWTNEDIIQTRMFWEPFNGFWLFISLTLLVFSAVLIYNQRPIERVKRFFDIA